MTTEMLPAAAQQQLDEALKSGDLTPSAAENIRKWLTEPRFAEYAEEVRAHMGAGQWQQLDDVFWTVIPFGTGGRRGKMYPIGCNAINDRTIGESAQGLADYVKSVSPADANLSCAIAYDTRHRSEHFAKLCSEIMVAAGFRVYLLSGHRSTPELSFAVRYKSCSCGIMVTASHNPPSDNAVKVYWSTGGQILPPHDRGVIERVMSIEHIDRRRFADAEAEGALIRCEEEVDEAFVAAVCREGTPGPRDLKVIYSPLHGVGATAVCPVLAKAGFADVEVFAAHATPDGDFPNVPDNVSNPENPAVFDTIIERAREVGADVAMATDPDCDRLGCAAPLTPSDDAPWRTFTGNQLGALLTDYVLESRAARGDLTAEHYIAITLVTTPFCRRIAESYGVKTVGDLLVGFKWIGGVIDEYGPDKFVFGAEESHGYLVGQYARDKDGAVAALLLSELAAKVKAEGQSLHEKLAALSWQHGAHAEKTVSIQMPGSEGMQRMQALMSRMRDDPPEVIAKMRVERVRDYLQQTARRPGASPTPLAGPQGDMVVIDLEREGNYVAIRPSGTEPKVKFYMFSFEAPELLADLDTTQTELAQRLEAMEAELREIANNE